MATIKQRNEQTPLMIRERPQTLESMKRTYHVYGIILGFLFLFSYFIYSYRSSLPTPLSDTEAKELDEFPGVHAYNEYLSRFIEPHPANSRENAAIKHWLGSLVIKLQKEAADNGVLVDVITNDSSRDVIPHSWFNDDEHWVVESRNVIVRLHGKSERDEAILINAHYDSVPTSNGVTDNGMGVATTMELLRYFVNHPPQHTIIFLFNNIEEGGLVGAQSFVRHPWYSSIKLFVNLEGAGAGGRAILFRCSNLDAVKKLSNSNVKLVHASPAGNDMFKANLIKSDTDYSVFTRHGIPGLDIAFYAPRSHYHTSRDDLAHTTPEALQHMGQLALAAVRAIVNSDDFLDATSEQESFVYFDVLGRVMFTYSLTVYQIINATILVATFPLLIYLSLKGKNRPLKNAMIEFSYRASQGFLATLSAFVSAVLFSIVAAFWMLKINPLLSYGDIYGVGFYMFFASFLGIHFSQLLLPNSWRRVFATTDAVWYGLVTFLWFLVLLSSYAGSKEIVSFYFIVYILFFNIAAVVTHSFIPQDKKFRSAVIFFAQTLIPFIFLIEQTFLSMDAMRHSTVDGSPEATIYIIISLSIILINMHFVPWIYVAGNNRKVTIGAAIVFLFLFIICSALHPFNGNWSPNKLLFRQEYTAGDIFSTVNVTTATGIPALLEQALPSDEYKTIRCEQGMLKTCIYQTQLLPRYASNETLNEFTFSGIKKSCDNDLCQAAGSYQAKNSLMCRIFWDQKIKHAWVDDLKIEYDSIRSLMIYVKEYNRVVNFAFNYDPTQAPKLTLSCLYDEWTKQELPAFTTLRDNLPEDALLLLRGNGLAIVNYHHIVL